MKNKDYQICRRCVMDTTDQEIQFDDTGVCNHCLYFDDVLSKKWYPNANGSRMLDEIILQIQSDGKNKKYDCVIGLSGGVDSSYLAYILKVRYPTLRILAIHIDGGWNSELAVHNIENIVKRLDIDLYTGVIPWDEMQDLQLAYFKSQLANQDVPQDHAFFATLYEVALKNDIKYFLSGGNLATESILPSFWGYDAMDSKQLKAIHKKFGTKRLKKYVTVSFFKRKVYYPYFLKFKVIRPLDYLPYNKDKSKEIIKQELDWRDYGGKHHESKFTKFFQAYWLPQKFGFDKRKAHLSSLIVSGQLNREDALLELNKPLYEEKELFDDKEYLAKKLGITMEEFDSIMNQPNKKFTDYPSNFHKERLFKKIIQKLSLIKNKIFK
jgi:N-acetyl sugar amidotransferase